MRRGKVAACAAMAIALLASRAAEQVGRTAPACKLTDVGDQQPVALEQYRGRVLWLDFWASWCATCAESFPFLNALERDFGARGLSVLAINLDEDPEDAREFLARHPARFAQAADRSGRCPREFGVEAMPSSYLVDRRGVIRHVQRGFRAGEAAELRAQIEALLAEEAGEPAR